MQLRAIATEVAGVGLEGTAATSGVEPPRRFGRRTLPDTELSCAEQHQQRRAGCLP